MNNLIPSSFTINGELKTTVQFEKDSLILLGAVILILIIMALIAQRIIKNA
jgi:hypothetical protein